MSVSFVVPDRLTAWLVVDTLAVVCGLLGIAMVIVNGSSAVPV